VPLILRRAHPAFESPGLAYSTTVSRDRVEEAEAFVAAVKEAAGLRCRHDALRRSPDKRRAARAWECRLVRRARLSPRYGYHRLRADHRPGASREKRAVRQPMVPKG